MCRKVSGFKNRVVGFIEDVGYTNHKLTFALGEFTVQRQIQPMNTVRVYSVFVCMDYILKYIIGIECPVIVQMPSTAQASLMFRRRQ